MPGQSFFLCTSSVRAANAGPGQQQYIDKYTDFDVFRTRAIMVPCTVLYELLAFHISLKELVKRKKKNGASCMPYFGTVSSLLQSVDSHGLSGGLTVGLPSTL